MFNELIYYYCYYSLTTGTSVDVTGVLIQSVGNKQSIELKIDTINILGECPADSYPLQKKRHRFVYFSFYQILNE